MKININCGYEEFDDPYNYKRNYNPYAKINIDISIDEMKDLQKNEKDTYCSIMRLVRRGCDEADRGVQVY